MVHLIKFAFSRNKKIYYSIAEEMGTSVKNVYKLARGKRAKNSKDYKILKRLVEYQIIEDISYN